MIKNVAKKIIRWSVTTSLLCFPRAKIKKAIFYAIQSKKGRFLFINDIIRIKSIYNPELLKVRDLIGEIKRETQMLLDEVEAIQIFRSIRQTSKIEGDIAEVGVFRGGSAKLICEAKETKNLHLFDTFKGLPALTREDSPRLFYENQFSASYDEVTHYLQNYQDVYFYKGLFPSTAGPIAHKNFSFVHIDVDLYEATLECIKFFYPRLNKGGILISHDYGFASGVKKAFDEFFYDKPEPIIELEMSGTQCLIVKI